MESLNVKRKNYFDECLKGFFSALILTVLCSIGLGVGQNLEERQWLGKFDWYGFLCIIMGAILGQTVQFLILVRIFNIA